MLRSINRGLIPTSTRARAPEIEVPLDAAETKLEDCQRDIGKNLRDFPGLPKVESNLASCDRSFCRGRGLFSNRCFDHVRYSPLTQHVRVGAEEAAPNLVRCTDGSLRPIRCRSAGRFFARGADKLHNRLAAETVSDRGEPA